ncbi:hypothetical protein D3C79_943750 [compost metagenome]
MPSAVMAMVRAKVSSVFTTWVTLPGSTCSEFTSTSARKPKANQGMAMRPLPCPWPGWRARLIHKPTTSNTGTSSITRVILTMVAMCVASGLTLLAAPTTWATSWIVPPRNSPAPRVSRCSQPALIASG